MKTSEKCRKPVSAVAKIFFLNSSDPVPENGTELEYISISL